MLRKVLIAISILVPTIVVSALTFAFPGIIMVSIIVVTLLPIIDTDDISYGFLPPIAYMTYLATSHNNQVAPL